MSNPRRTMREFARLLKQHGVTIDELRTSGKHPVYKLTGPDGTKFTMTAPCTASDWRSVKNKIAELKTYLRQHEEHTA